MKKVTLVIPENSKEIREDEIRNVNQNLIRKAGKYSDKDLFEAVEESTKLVHKYNLMIGQLEDELKGARKTKIIPIRNTQRDVMIEFYAAIDADYFNELKKVVDHHIDYLVDLESYPEIKKIYRAVMVEDKDLAFTIRDEGEPEEKYVKIGFCITVGERFIEELKRIVDHHLEYMLDLDNVPEINAVFNAKMTVLDNTGGEENG